MKGRYQERVSEWWLFCGAYVGGGGLRRHRGDVCVCVYDGGSHVGENHVVKT